MFTRTLFIAVLVALFCNIGCSQIPTSFVKTYEPAFKEIPVRESLAYDAAWDRVVDIMARHYNIEVLAKEDGYIRTGWNHYSTGKLLQRYRVRITVKFHETHDQVTLKTEAQYSTQTGWTMGYDKTVLDEVHQDLQAQLGRTVIQ